VVVDSECLKEGGLDMPLTGPDIVLYEKKDEIAIITLNRPERLNAIIPELTERMADAFRRFNADDDVRVAIVCGAGRAFCAGMDLKETNRGQTRPSRGLSSILEIPKPTIAAIQGYAIGGGFRIAKLCDIRIAAEDAEFGIAEARWSQNASFVTDLTRQMHLGHALELALWGDKRIPAQRAYEMGFVNKLVPKENLMDEAMAWAERMLSMAPRAVRTIKKLLYQGFYVPPEQLYEFSFAMEEVMFKSEDAEEGRRAFREGRKPQFEDR